MRKLYLLMTLLLTVAFTGSAATSVDELTADRLGLGTSYGFFESNNVESNNFPSATVYAAYAMKSTAAATKDAIQINNGSKTVNNVKYYYGIYNTTTVGNARKVEVTWSSTTSDGRILEIYGRKAETFDYLSAYSSQGTKLGVITKGKSTTLDITDGDYPYIAVVSQSKAQYIESIKITWETAGKITKCATPVISMPETDYGRSDVDSTPVNITCSTQGATIHYFTYNLIDNPTGEATADQYLVYDPENVPTLMCSGTYGIKAYASLAGIDDSDVAEHLFAYNQYGRASDLADFVQQGIWTVQEGYYHLLYCPVYVTAQSTNGKYTFIRDDNNNALLIYGDLGMTLTNGQKFPSKAFAAQSVQYNGTYEMTETRVLENVLDTPSPEKTLPFEKTIAEVTTDQQSQYIVIKGATIDSTAKTIAVGDATLAYYLNRFGATLPGDLTQKYDVVGVVEIYNNAPQIAVTEFVLADETPAQVYAVGNVNGNEWAYDSGVVLAKTAPGVYSGELTIEHGAYFTITDALASTWDELNNYKYGIVGELYSKVGTAVSIVKQSGAQIRNFWPGTYTVTVDLNNMTFKLENPEVFPAQLRILGSMENNDWNITVEKAVVANKEGVATYKFNGVLLNAGGQFMFTSAVGSSAWDGTNEINDWAIKAADADNCTLVPLGSVELAPWTNTNVVVGADNSFGYASYDLTVDLAAQTVTSEAFSGVKSISLNSAKVVAEQGAIVVEGAGVVSIYNAAGQAVVANSAAGTFRVPAGLYMVRIDDKVVKVMVR